MVEIIAEDLDGDLGVDARNHVPHQVCQGLFDLDVHAGHLLAQLVEQLFEDLLTPPPTLRVHAQDVLASVDG